MAKRKRVSVPKTTFLKPKSAMKARGTLQPNENFEKKHRVEELK